MIEDNKNIEPNIFSKNQKTYELINDDINDNNQIPLYTFFKIIIHFL